MRTAIIIAGMGLLLGAGCTDRAEPQVSAVMGADCDQDASCLQIAFTGFRGEAAELYLNDRMVFRGRLQTQDWTNELSQTAEFRTAKLEHVRLKIDGQIVHDESVSNETVRTIYIQPRAPYVLLTDHPGPLLD